MHWHTHDDNVVHARTGRRRFWSNRRVWLNRRCDHGARCASIRVEWSVPAGHCGWSVTLGGGDSGQDLGFTFAIPLLLTLYVTIENVFRPYRFGSDIDRGHDRQIGCYFHAWALWYHVWVGSMASWSRDYPWCRWWRQGSIHFDDLLLGRRRHSLLVVRERIPIQIPMPEGTYAAFATFEERTWKRPRWFTDRRRFTSVEVPKGIPFAGKGENSWDCGDDGLFGYGVEGHDLSKAIAHGVESVLESRRRYGHASADTIERALAR